MTHFKKSAFYYFLIGLAQWPTCVSLLAVIRFEQPGDAFDWLAFILSVLAIVFLAASRRSRPILFLMIAMVSLTAAALIAIGPISLKGFLVLAALGWLAAAIDVHQNDYRRLSVWLRQASFVFALLFLAELVLTTHMYIRALQGAVPIEDNLYQPDREMTTTLIPGAKSLHPFRDIFKAEYVIQSDGTRRVTSRRSDRADRPKWVFWGCSFTFGWGLNEEDTVAGIIQEKHPDIEVINHGIPSHGTADVYLYMKRYLPRHHDVPLSIYFLIQDHFYRTTYPLSKVPQDPVLWRDRPAFALENGQLILKGKLAEYLTGGDARLARILQQAQLASLLPVAWSPSDDDLVIMTALMKAMKATCDSAQSKLVLVYLPTDQPEDASIRAWVNQIRDDDFNLLDFYAYFEEHLAQQGESKESYFFPIDRHPNPRYTKLLADWLDSKLSME